MFSHIRTVHNHKQPDPALLQTSYLSNEIKRISKFRRETFPLRLRGIIQNISPNIKEKSNDSGADLQKRQA
jgi:hypothetical protein